MPIHPKWNVLDWDTASGAINWPHLISFLQKFKITGEIPTDYRRDLHLVENPNPSVRDEVVLLWTHSFHLLESKMKARSERIVWGLVDRFLLYWDHVRHIMVNIKCPDTSGSEHY